MGKVSSAGLKIFTAGVGAAAAGVSALGTQSVKSYADYEQLIGGVETLFAKTGTTYEEMYETGVAAGKSLEEIHAQWLDEMSAVDEVLSNADKAYKTAGLSANDYMEIVTGFAASLKQSCKDEMEAAQIADQAVIDMSDNANKMGTSMESIQNAYQGFAKQNYTMLDNLKLGYGGTKEEMQRLLADAEKLSGIKYDISSLSDVYSAIHVIQTELGITGTTAIEASTTISGSLNSMKASWANLIVGIADENQDFDALVNDFVESAATAAENLLPRIEVVLSGLGMLIVNLAPVIAEKVPQIISDILPDILQAGMDFIAALIQGIRDNFPALMAAASDIVDTLLEGIGDICPALEPVTAAIGFLKDHFEGILAVVIPVVTAFITFKSALAITSMINGVVKAVLALNAALLANPIMAIIALIAALVAGVIYLWNTNEGFREFWVNLWENIKEVVSTAIDAIVGFFTETIPNAIDSLVDFVKNNWQSLLMLLNPATMLAGIFKLVYDNCDGFRNFVDGFVKDIKDYFVNAWNSVLAFFTETLPSLPEKFMYWLGFALTSVVLWGADLADWVVTNVPRIINDIITFFATLPAEITNWLLQCLLGAIEWGNNMRLKALETGRKFLDGVSDYLKTLPGKVDAWFKQTVKKAGDFVIDLKNKALEAGKGFVKNITEALAGLPDKMKEIGLNIVDGIMSGLKSGWKKLSDYVSNLANSLFEGAKNALDIHSPSRKFKWLAQMCIAGFDEGFEGFEDKPVALARAVNASFSAVQANMRGSRSVAGFNGYGNFNQTINVNQQVSTPDELARAIRLESKYGLMQGVVYG